MSRTRSGRCRTIAFTVSLLLLPAAWLGSSATAATPTPTAAQAATASHTSTAAAARQTADSGPAVHHDTSPTLLSMAAARAAGDRTGKAAGLPRPAASTVMEPGVQSALSAEAAAATGTSFDGIPYGVPLVQSFPPNPNAAVGATQIMEVSYGAFAVYSKSGTAQIPPTEINVLWSDMGGPCENGGDDPTVRWDSVAHRWVILETDNFADGPFFTCAAVSTSSDATGSYNRYVFQYSSWPTRPKLSVWRDAYYFTSDMVSFPPGGGVGTDLGAEVCALNRVDMLSGGAAAQQCFATGSPSFQGLLAADLDGTTPPPSGEPETLLSLGQTNATLSYWKFHVDWLTPANSTFSGPSTLNVSPFSVACGAGLAACIPQAGTTQLLNAGPDALMYRLAYRNFGDHESLVVNHSVNAGSSVGVRWYELRLSGGDPTVFQQGTYAPADGVFRWAGSVAMDKVGNIGLGFSGSSGTLRPSIRVTGRLAGDPAGTMPQGESTLITGAGSQTDFASWAFFSSMAVDPSDDCTFWYTNGYYASNTFSDWRSRIGSFTLPNCATGTATNDFSIGVNPVSGSVVAGSSATTTVSTAVTSGNAENANLSVSGLPLGATATFSPASLIAGGSSTLTIATSASTPSGAYPLTVTGTGTTKHSATYTLTVTGGAAGGCTGVPLTFASYSTLTSESTGPQVRAAQCLLRTAGFSTGPGDPTQVFDDATVAATTSFQKAHGLSQTGIVDSHTWTALLSFGTTPILSTTQNPTNAAVSRLQRALTAALGRTITVTGTFNTATDTAVKDYQSSRHLMSVDGIVGPETWGALQSGR